jgi:hypothetical protein
MDKIEEEFNQMLIHKQDFIDTEIDQLIDELVHKYCPIIYKVYNLYRIVFEYQEDVIECNSEKEHEIHIKLNDDHNPTILRLFKRIFHLL